jgi:hypothetical protein
MISMKRLIILMVLVSAITYVSAQGYKHALGIRTAWHTPGFEYRFYPSDMNSYKLLLSVRDRGLQLHALAEFYEYDLFSFSHQLNFLYGLGAHAGYDTKDIVRTQGNATWQDTKKSFLVGLDGLAGLEYVFYEAPLIAGFEVKPYFDLFGRNGFDVVLLDFALTVKYIF